MVSNRSMPGLFEELKRRNVFRVGIAYAAAAWVLLQLTDVVAPILALPDWVPRLVLSLIALGFVPALILAWAFELTADGIRREKDVDRTGQVPQSSGRNLNLVIIAVLALGIVLLLVDKFSRPEVRSAAEPGSASIAVLPFANLSADTEQAYFSDGITEEILNALASVREIRVAGRTSSFAFRDRNDDPRQIGATLGVNHLLEGSVRRSGKTVRVSATLIQVADGFQVWSQTYERKLTDIFEIQDEIARSILRELKTTLLPGTRAASVRDRTSPEAYERFLRARQRMYERSQPSLEEARRLLDEVIDLDPEYAPAYAQRGIVTILLSDNNYGTLPAAEAQRRSKRYIDLALELDAESPEALAGLGLYYTGEPGRTQDAIAVLKRALSINPNQLAASLWLSSALGDTGDTRGGLEVLEALMARDPLFRPAFSNAVFVFEQYGMSDKAAALIERVRQFDPNDPVLIQAEAVHLYFAGDMVEGLLKAERAVALAPNSTIALAFYAGGLRQTHQLAKLAQLPRISMAADALDALGRRDEALELAYSFAANGDLFPLFNLLNRAARHADVIAYIDERWPGLDAFEHEHDPGPVGYPVMLAIAHAYKMVGDERNAADATERYVRGIERVRDQGVDNRFIEFETAAYHALIGDHDAAMATLDSFADQGMFVLLPLSKSTPEFGQLANDPRFVSIESRILGVVNAQRAELGLGPVDPARDFWQYGAR